MRHVLDNPAWAALTGPHRHLAQVNGRAARYRSDVSIFIGLADPADPAAWADLAGITEPGEDVSIGGTGVSVPPGWQIWFQGAGLQMVGADPAPSSPDPQVEALSPEHLPEMLDLIERTDPGPFRHGTIAMGSYLGIRRGGRLVSMAGERVRPPGHTEISAVCTDPEFRRQGLASRLIRAVTAGIRGRGDTPYLHVLASNTGAVRLYEALGFTVRRETTFYALKVPACSTR